MKGPMKGATIGHSKQRIQNGRYIGLTEPGIVAAEPPNPIVNHLVIMPDIEKRLEGFVRLGHGIIIFPGGVGTTEEILYLLGVLLDPANADQPMPLVLTGPASSAAYFQHVNDFIGLTLGPEAQKRYRIIIEDPAEAARAMVAGVARVRQHRTVTGEAFNFNWTLNVPRDMQMPFEVTHESVAALDLSLDQPFEISGDPKLMRHIDALLAAFVAQKRMKLSGEYHPVYRVIA
jgi:predicted Rossmann-fold nucleotide-binding protein